jgi:hypothetical protein
MDDIGDADPMLLSELKPFCELVYCGPVILLMSRKPKFARDRVTGPRHVSDKRDRLVRPKDQIIGQPRFDQEFQIGDLYFWAGKPPNQHAPHATDIPVGRAGDHAQRSGLLQFLAEILRTDARSVTMTGPNRNPLRQTISPDAEVSTFAREHHRRHAAAVVGGGCARLSGWLHDRKRTSPGG